MLNFSKLPEALRKPAHAWVMHGVMPTDPLLTAVVVGKLKDASRASQAVGQADFLSIVRWFNEEAPGNCWGSNEDALFWKENFRELVGEPVACDTCGAMAVHIAVSPITLGGFIKQLEKLPQQLRVVFDSGEMPGRFSSWRGDYSKLALQMDGKQDTTVMELINRATACRDEEFEGYKGGTYTMDDSTDLHAANWGECGREIALVVQRGAHAVIITRTGE